MSVITVDEECSLFADDGQHSLSLRSLYTPSTARSHTSIVDECLVFEQRLMNLPGYIFSGVEKHNQNLAHLQVLAHRLRNNLETLFDKLRPTHLLLFGHGGYPTQLLFRIGQQRNITTFHFECSLFPDTIQMHKQGVNASSGLANAPLPQHATHFAKHQLTLYHDGPRISLRPSLPMQWAYPSNYLWKADRFPFSLKTSDRWYVLTRQWAQRALYYSRGLRLANERAKLPNKYIFIPLQVHDDTQIILNGGLATTLSDWLINIARVCPPEIPLVFKPHPADFGRYSLQKIKATVSRLHKRAIFVSEVSVSELIVGARAIVTVNSTAGFEALLDGKPVIACGKNLWIRPELCCCPANYHELGVMMAKGWHGNLPRPSRSTLERCLSLAFDSIFVSGRIGCLEEAEAEVLASRILAA